MNKLFFLIILFCLSLNLSADKFVWNAKANYPSFPRHRVSGISIGNRGYMGMGHINSGTISLAYHDWWEYDPSTDSWSQKADYPLDRFAVVGFSIGNKGYMGSGNEQSFGDKQEFFEYDPITNVWTPKANFPFPAGGNTAFAINGIGYMGFGNGLGLYSYSPILNTWTSVSTPIGPSDYSSSFVIANKAYILPAFGTAFYEFDPATGFTTTKAPFIGDARYAAVSFAVRNQGYVGLGAGGPTWADLKDFYFYDPILNAWDTIPKAFPGGRRHYVPSFVIGDNAFFGTGSNGTNLGDIWAYEWKISVGINEYNKGTDISIFPNPTTDFISINVTEEVKNISPKIQIFTGDGKEVLSQKINETKNTFDVSKFAKGVYYISLSNETKLISTKKIIIN
jgi:N-acetylneuraminic acid mutarotase